MANTIGNYIKALRIQADMTQESLAAILHVSRQTISNFEREKMYPDIDQLTEIAAIFQVDIRDLINAKTRTANRKRCLITYIIILACLLGFIILLLILTAWSKKAAHEAGIPDWFSMMTKSILFPIIILCSTICSSNIALFLASGKVDVTKKTRILTLSFLLMIILYLIINTYAVLIMASNKGTLFHWIEKTSMDFSIFSLNNTILFYPFYIFGGVMVGITLFYSFEKRYGVV